MDQIKKYIMFKQQAVLLAKELLLKDNTDILFIMEDPKREIGLSGHISTNSSSITFRPKEGWEEKLTGCRFDYIFIEKPEQDLLESMLFRVTDSWKVFSFESD